MLWLSSANPVIDWKHGKILGPLPVLHSLVPKQLTSALVEEHYFAILLSGPVVADSVLLAHGTVSTTSDSVTDFNSATDLFGSSPATDDTPVLVLPEKYKDFAIIFEKKAAETLPRHHSYDSNIDLKPGAKVPWGPIYSLTESELQELCKYLDENLAHSFIRPAQSPGGAPIMFVKKKDGSLRLCIDYHNLNAVTVKNRYPLPLFSDMLRRMCGAKIYTHIDLRNHNAYNLIRITAGDEWKTTFCCRYGHFEYLVMPYGLTNAPATFQHMMNEIFADIMDQFVVIYLNDILIFSFDPSQHAEHVREVLSRLCKHGLYAKLEKCEFDVDSIEFVGYIIFPQGLGMDPKKVAVIQSWPIPKSIKDVQSFLGFCNSYHMFIKSFSRRTAALTYLTRKGVPFRWTEKTQLAFVQLKITPCRTQIFRIFHSFRTRCSSTTSTVLTNVGRIVRQGAAI